jgi:hypothetical protein
VYNKTLAIVKRHIQQAAKQTPVGVRIVAAAGVENSILPEDFSSTVELGKRDIGSTDPDIPIDNNCTNDKL